MMVSMNTFYAYYSDYSRFQQILKLTEAQEKGIHCASVDVEEA